MLLLENISKDELKEYIKEFYSYALTRLKKIDREPKVFFMHDKKNADNFFGKTGYYDPQEEKIVLYVTGRHPKDILRSFAHELVHHHQKCNGEGEGVNLSLTASDPAYASHNQDLRKMEKQAFRWGNMIFRDWCDMKKTQKKETTMSESKNDLVELVLERVTKRLIQEAKKKGSAKKESKMPMKDEPKGEDLNADGKKGHGKVPAFLDKGDAKKKKGGGDAVPKRVPKQLQKYVKGKMKKESVEEEKENLQESVKHPYPELFQKRDRLFNDRFGNYENLIYEELIKRTIK